jgi:serine/threonine protein kinase/class 3 adenylate cyclase
MNLQSALGSRDRVEAFQRRHRVGLLTLLFTDVVGSTRLKQTLGDGRAVDLLERHHSLVRKILGDFKEGEEISTAGDSFFLVFTRPSDGVKFSLLLQRHMRELVAETGHNLCDRIGLHVGEVLIAEHAGKGDTRDLYGIQVDICARVVSLAQGTQILMTRFAFDSARQVLKGEELDGVGPLVWLNHGRYRLKGIEDPVEVCAVGEQGSSPATRPGNTEKGHRLDTLENEPLLGWRPALQQAVPQTRWVLEKMLGEGGFGEVWLARHRLLGHQSVFKFCFRADRARSLRREVTLFRVMKERFGAHPHIVSVRDVFLEEPPYYIEMDYSDGQDLRAWCEHQGGLGALPLPVRLEIVAQVADALQAAHDAGVIHRDVKPANILVSGDGATTGHVQVKLTDFGIGQIVSEEVLQGLTKGGFTHGLGSTKSNNGLTGTQLYMAPELVAGKPASPASDVYALGVVLYQMLLADFSAPVTLDCLDNIHESQLRRDLARCFAGNPKQRFDRIAQLAQNLRGFQPSAALPRDPVQVITAKTENRTLTPARSPSETDTDYYRPSRLERQVPDAEARPEDGNPFLAHGLPTPLSLIDLSRFYNANLTDDWCNCVGHNLATLSREGRIQVRGTQFDPGGIIQVGCFQLEKLKAAYPQRVDGIPIERTCRRFHFLHAALGREPDGTRIGSYVVHSPDSQHEIPIIYGEDLRSWLCESDPKRELKRALTAWTGRTSGLFLRSIRLFKFTWANPRPEEQVVTLDFQSVVSEAAPFLIALTVE